MKGRPAVRDRSPRPAYAGTAHLAPGTIRLNHQQGRVRVMNYRGPIVLGVLSLLLAGCARDNESRQGPNDLSEAASMLTEGRPETSQDLAPPAGGDVQSDAREAEMVAAAALPAGGPASPDERAGLTPPATSSPAMTERPVPEATATATAPAGRAEQILERAEAAYDRLRSLEADFVQQVYIPLLETTQNSRGKLYHRAPDRFLMRFTEPQGDVVVADGRYVWMYYPSNDPRQVMRGRLAEGGQQVDLQREFLSDATNRFSATLEGTERVGGRTAEALTLIPRGPSPYREIKIWVDTEDALVRRFEITEQNETVRKLEMSNLRPNVALADDLFRFTPPPGAEIFEP